METVTPDSFGLTEEARSMIKHIDRLLCGRQRVQRECCHFLKKTILMTIDQPKRLMQHAPGREATSL